MRARTCAVGRGIVWPSLVISRAVRMARLREAQEHPDWKWEGERRRAIGDRVEATRPGPPRRSLVPVTAEWRRSLDRIRVTELLASIDLLPGQVIIHCQNMEHLLQQLVQLAKTLDNDYETLQSTRRRRNRMKSIRNSISNACWALSQLPSC